MGSITVENDVFVAKYPFADKHVPKEAGFWWHGGGCRNTCIACKNGLPLKRWWTPKPEVAGKLIADADALAKAALATHMKALEMSRAADADIEPPCPEGLAYLPYQNAGIAYAMHRKNVLIADEMGLGKTIQALGTVNVLGDGVKSVLIIMPSCVRINWKREAERWLIRPWNIFEVDSMKVDIPADADLIVVNYEMLRGKTVSLYETEPVVVGGEPQLDDEGQPLMQPKVDRQGDKIRLIDKATGKPAGRFEPSPVLAQLMSRTWDALIVDECHRLRNAKSLQAKCILGFPGTKAKGFTDEVEGLVEQSSRRIFLTGTPVMNRPVDLWPIISTLAPDVFNNFFAFAKRYCGAVRTRWGWDFSGATNLPELQDKLRSSIMVRRKKADVLKELPAKRRQIIPLSPAGMSAFLKAEKTAFGGRADKMEALRNELDLAHASNDKEAYEAAVDRLKEFNRVAFTEMAKVRKELAIAKIPRAIEFIDAVLESESKVVLFAHHHEVVEALQEHYGDKSVSFTGLEMSKAKRQESVDRFQGDPSVHVFIGSAAAGEGITLTAASTVIFVELDWVPQNISQREDRCHRIGQLNSVNVYHLVIDGSMDQQMAEAIVTKQNIADAALDDITATALASEPTTPTIRPVRPSKYPPVAPEKRAAALVAMQQLAGLCDGAREKDGCGFNKIDSNVGKKLASMSELTDGQAWLATTLARKYQRQLGGDLLEALGIQGKKAA